MRKIVMATILFVLFSNHIEAQDRKLNDYKIDLQVDCALDKSAMIAKQHNGCGQAKPEFTATKKALLEWNKGHRSYVIKSWMDFITFREEYYKSPFLMTSISKDFLKRIT